MANIWKESRSEPGLHIKRAGNVKNNSLAIGVPNPATTLAASKRIVLGTKNQGTSKLDGVTK